MSSPLLPSGDEDALQRRIDRAIDRLKSPDDGELGAIEAMELGPDVIPASRKLVFKREPSGLFRSRCLAVEALGALKGFGDLGDFLRLQREIADPVERFGEDAVIAPPDAPWRKCARTGFIACSRSSLAAGPCRAC